MPCHISSTVQSANVEDVVNGAGGYARGQQRDKREWEGVGHLCGVDDSSKFSAFAVIDKADLYLRNET